MMKIDEEYRQDQEKMLLFLLLLRICNSNDVSFQRESDTTIKIPSKRDLKQQDK